MKFKQIPINGTFFVQETNLTTSETEWCKYEKVSEDRAIKLSGGSTSGPFYMYQSEEVMPSSFQPPVKPTTNKVKTDRRVVLMTTKMFQVANYDDGTAELVGCTLLPHPTMEFTGDGSLQNPFKIVEKT